MVGNEYLRVLKSSWIDEELLFGKLGLTRKDENEFRKLYYFVRTEQPLSLSYFFDPIYYLEKYADVKASGIDPLIHFLSWGAKERRSPHPLVSLEHLALVAPWKATVSDQIAEEIAKILYRGNVSSHPYIDLDVYVEYHPEAKDYAGGPLLHLFQYGHTTHAKPNVFFDPVWYSERYSDVPNSTYESLLHFSTIGDAQRRRPSSAFDPEWYLNSYRDLTEKCQRPLLHFLMHGRQEGRVPAPYEVMPPSSYDERRSDLIATAASWEPDQARYDGLKARLLESRQQRVHGYVERHVDLPCRGVDDVSEMVATGFPVASDPLVSILVPCYNEYEITLECLSSIFKSATKATYEVIIADDASTDERFLGLGQIRNLRVYRSTHNQGFLGNCNSVYSHCQGKYLLLLNNDAQISVGFVDILVDALESAPDIGAVGPKICYPNGRLQEAGCAVNRDGSTIMVGLLEDAHDAVYNWRRDVHYCSGAGLIVRKDLIDGNLFDTRFGSAYCEDLDLCMRVLDQGRRVVYEPSAVLYHHLSVSTAKTSKVSKIQQIRENQDILVKKWGDRLVDESQVKTIAYYLPQFHPTPENDLWWGAGFTEWRNVSRAKPSYDGHHQPHLPADLGYYDLRVSETLLQQSQLARRYGIDGFCVYYYNFNGRRLLGRPLDVVLENPDIPFNFCICWANENWSRRWDGGNHSLLMKQLYDADALATIADDVFRFSSDSRYLRVNGKPLVLIYRPLLLQPSPSSVADTLRDLCAKNGAGEIYLVYVESMETLHSDVVPSSIGFDAAVEFPPQGIAVPNLNPSPVVKEHWAGHRYDYEATVLKALSRRNQNYKRFPAVFPSWDNTARQPLVGTSFDGASPEAFQLYCEEKLGEAKNFFVGDERLMFVNAWNEWAEGAHLEPDELFGHAWLEALRAAKFNTGTL